MGIESFLKNPMEIHIEGNLQHNRYDWQKGKGADDVEQTLWQPYTLLSFQSHGQRIRLPLNCDA